jgi:hypothetical protein
VRSARPLRLLVAALASVAVLAACDDPSNSEGLARPSRAFCAAAAKYDAALDKGRVSLDKQIELVRGIADAAPKDVAKDARTFLDALERRSRGDKGVVDNPKIQAAVEHVNRRAAQGCGWYRRQSGI